MAAAVKVTSDDCNKEHKEQYLTNIGMANYCKKRSQKENRKNSSGENKLKTIISKA